MHLVLDHSPENPPSYFDGLHTPSPSFQRGKPLPIAAARASDKIAGLHLRYRHINQAELWRETKMERMGDDYRAVVAADYTDSPFHLQYYFQIRAHSGDVWLQPGLEHRWHGQPYFFVQQA
jgi:hypothetical protein